MALPGKPSTAHVYGKSGECVYCSMYESAVNIFKHLCTRERELAVDGHYKKEVADGK
jgi:hypothetical protein